MQSAPRLCHRGSAAACDLSEQPQPFAKSAHLYSLPAPAIVGGLAMGHVVAPA